MASIAMMVGGAVVNALAFTGGNYLFSQFNKSAALDEQKRHNLAEEKMAKDREEYSKKLQIAFDWRRTQEDRGLDARSAVRDTNSAFDDYSRLTHEPVLSDYYVPSDEQKKYEMIFITGGLVGTAYIANKYLLK